MRRTAEVWLAGVGATLTAILLGGFAVVVNHQRDEAAFRANVLPSLEAAGLVLPESDPFLFARTLAAWFGFTAIAVVGLTIAGILLTRARPRWRRNAWWFVAAGIACLVGSQFALYPVAFLFFLAAGLFAVRKVPASPESPSPAISTTGVPR